MEIKGAQISMREFYLFIIIIIFYVMVNEVYQSINAVLSYPIFSCLKF